MPTILLVEDDAALRRMLDEALGSAGFRVVQVSDTTHALSELRSGRAIDLCLVDLVMPEGEPDGLAFARNVKGHRPETPIILMTGYYGFVARSGELPAKVLYKPIDIDALVAEIRSELRL